MLMLAALGLLSPASAATLTVDPDLTDAYATVAEALERANDGDTIEVAAGTYTDCLEISELSVTIEGTGEDTVLDGGGACDPLVWIEDGAVALESLALTNLGEPALEAEDSDVVLDAVVVHDSGDAQYYYGGAAISIWGGSLTVDSSTLRDNAGYYGGHIYASDGAELLIGGSTLSGGLAYYGGGIFLDDFAALESTDSTYQSNTTYYYGGVLYMAGHSSVSSNDDTWLENSADTYYYGGGGAAYITDFSNFSATGSTFEGHAAIYGGALWLGGYGAIDLRETSWMSNSATVGGAVYLSTATVMTDVGSAFSLNTGGSGGAVYLTGGSLLSLEGSTFEDNSSTGYGGALYAYSGSAVEADGTTFRANSADYGGGAAYIGYADEVSVFVDAIVEDNVAEGNYGGGIYASSEAHLRIEGGTFSGNSAYSYGGAISSWYYSDLDISGATFADNTIATASGGAVSWYPYRPSGDEMVIEDSVFEGNEAGGGGGAVLAYYGEKAVITGSSFSNNLAGADPVETAYTYGGALYASSMTEIEVSHSSFCNNLAGSGGAAYIYYNAADSWTNNIFVENEGYQGGALLHYYNSSSSVVNNTFVGNTSPTYGGSHYVIYTPVELVNNAFVDTLDGTGVYYYDYDSLIDGAVAYNLWHANDWDDGGGELWFTDGDDGNVIDEPGFIDWSLDGDCTNDDLRPGSYSALLDAGDPEILDADGTVSDIGAYGGPGAQVWDYDEDGYDRGEDCDDFDADVFPGADETCNEVDDDCDGEIDEDAVDLPTWYTDADGDGFGDTDGAFEACGPGADGSSDGQDCDDTDPMIYPGAEEILDDDIDQDCDGEDATSEPESHGPELGQQQDACGCSAPAGVTGVAWVLGLLSLARRRRS